MNIFNDLIKKTDVFAPVFIFNKCIFIPEHILHPIHFRRLLYDRLI